VPFLENHPLLSLKRARLVVSLFGREVEIFCRILDYTPPFISIETREGKRILNENAVKEITPLD
jgi:hypothetical protein